LTQKPLSAYLLRRNHTLFAEINVRLGKRLRTSGIAVAVALSALLMTSQSALGVCFPPFNEGVAIGYDGTSVAKGGYSEVDLFTATTSTGHGIAHPFQLGSNAVMSNDFIGWGTTLGVGTTGGITNCPSDYSSGWHVYADGRQNGAYWCRQGSYGDLSGSAQNQQFKIRYGTCAQNGLQRFVLYLNAVEKTCALIDSTSGSLAIGSESIGTTVTQSLAVNYTDLKVYFTSGWFAWNSPYLYCNTDTPYDYFRVSNTEYWMTAG
jgi:hypothetical protein